MYLLLSIACVIILIDTILLTSQKETEPICEVSFRPYYNISEMNGLVITGNEAKKFGIDTGENPHNKYEVKINGKDIILTRINKESSNENKK
jgi:hypothetical protein